jgi:hypothetical protein
MVDRTSLEVVGFIFGGVTAVVIVIAAVVVASNMTRAVAFDQEVAVPAPVSTAARD